MLREVCHGFKYPVVFRTSADSMEFEAIHRTYALNAARIASNKSVISDIC